MASHLLFDQLTNTLLSQSGVHGMCVSKCNCAT
jgi:hypothetical protein